MELKIYAHHRFSSRSMSLHGLAFSVHNKFREIPFDETTIEKKNESKQKQNL